MCQRIDGRCGLYVSLPFAGEKFTLGDMLARMEAGRLVSREVSQKMMSIMACQQLGRFDKSLPRVLRPNSARTPLGAIPEGRVVLAQKGGTLTGIVYHDTAVMLLPNGRSAVMAMMTETADGDRALEVIKGVSRAIYDKLI